MKKSLYLYPFLLALLILSIVLTLPAASVQAQTDPNTPLIVGHVFDKQGQAIKAAEISLRAPGEKEALGTATTQPDGTFELTVSDSLPDTMVVAIARPHFQDTEVELSTTDIQHLQSGTSIILPDVEMERHIGAAFWIATIVFILALIFIATGKMHNTLSALLGMAVLLGISYLGPLISEELYIFDFKTSLEYVDWNVVFLIMGMMMLIAVVEGTGIFQWLAFAAYRVSGGRMWLLLPILMVIAGVASAFLDNVTTMLLMTPITIQISLALGINPLALLMPQVFASNVAGISTLVGTPTNILIGSYAGISFGDFLVNLTPGVLLAMVGLILYSEYIYRKSLKSSGEISPALLERLKERAQITEPDHLKKAGVVGAFMLVLFIFGEHVHLVPAVTAMMGATALLVWIRPDLEEMIHAVDWTTLVFFITLFIVVGAVQEVGLISVIADLISRMVGENLVLAMMVLVWASALLSTVVANIPFTAAMLPVVSYLTKTIPGAESLVLFYCLSVGSAMGGNGSLIGASANMITSGISERAGYPITYVYFLKKGLPALFITVGLASIWLLIHF
ncbi:MAG: anion permease [Anaerolineales bacterium]|nr:anion permease [Anaerolineales bacterium]